MKVRLLLTVDDRDRYVVAKVCDRDPETRRKLRTYATRAEVRTFAVGAIRRMLREHAEALRGRERAVERRLAAGEKIERHEPEVPAPDERQSFLFDQ